MATTQFIMAAKIKVYLERRKRLSKPLIFFSFRSLNLQTFVCKFADSSLHWNIKMAPAADVSGPTTSSLLSAQPLVSPPLSHNGVSGGGGGVSDIEFTP